jgi:outer membrane biosynthesis protein TonB
MMKGITRQFTLLVPLVVVLLTASLSDTSVEASFGGHHGRWRFRHKRSPPPPPPRVPPPKSSAPPPPPKSSPPPPPPKSSPPPPPPKSTPPPPLPTPGLRVGFYANTACSNVEDVVRAEVQAAVAANPEIVALLLRMYFHDCFADVSAKLV